MAKDEIVIANTVRRSEFARTVNPWRGQWLTLVNVTVFSGLPAWAVATKYMHLRPSLFTAEVAAFCLWCAVWWIAGQLRTYRLFPTANSTLSLVTKLATDGFSQTVGETTTFVPWKSVRRIIDMPVAYALVTGQSGCFYIFKDSEPTTRGVPLWQTLTMLQRGDFRGTLITDEEKIWPPAPTPRKDAPHA